MKKRHNNNRFVGKQRSQKPFTITKKDLDKMKMVEGFAMFLEGLTGKPFHVIVEESLNDKEPPVIGIEGEINLPE